MPELSRTQILLIIAIALMSLIIIKTIIDMIIKAKKNKRYIQTFESNYKGGSVCKALENMKDTYKDGSSEKVAIEKSINYLQHSCLKDYQTAFAMIEDVCVGKKIEKFHDKILEQEKQKVIFMLEKRED